MKKIIFLFSFIACFGSASKTYAGNGNFTVGLGPVGNLFIIDSRPELDPGVGGLVYFDYRWAPQLSTAISILVTTEDGTGPDNGDNGIEFLGMPTFDVKFYLLTRASQWDPFVHVGVGIYAVTEGARNNDTVAVGLGADIGGGFDYYLTEQITVGLGMQYRSIGLVDGWGGPGNGMFPLTLNGTIAYHF